MVFSHYSGFGITYPAGSPEADAQANTIAGVKEACNALAVTAPMTREYLAAQKKSRYAVCDRRSDADA
jgi:hypothetical protein